MGERVGECVGGCERVRGCEGVGVCVREWESVWEGVRGCEGVGVCVREWESV